MPKYELKNVTKPTKYTQKLHEITARYFFLWLFTENSHPNKYTCITGKPMFLNNTKTNTICTAKHCQFHHRQGAFLLSHGLIQNEIIKVTNVNSIETNSEISTLRR